MAFGLGARACLAAATALGMAAAAAAQDSPLAVQPLSAADPQSGWYVSGGPGVSRYHVLKEQSGPDGHETLTGHGGKLMLGYQFRRSLRLEAGAVSLGSDWKTGPAIALVGAIHLGDRVALLGRLGAYYRRTARNDTFLGINNGDRDEEGTEPTVGIGVEWYLQPHTSVLFEYESFESKVQYWFDETRGANMATLSLRYRF